VQVPKSERVAVSIQAVMKPLSPALLAGADEALDTAMRRLVRNEAARLLVLENGRLVGLLTMSSLVRHIQVREELAA
jgi:CBS domain-containing protein